MERYQYKIKNLDCAMCAKKIEDALKKLDWVESASVNFNTEKIVIATARREGVLEDVRKVVSASEPECKVSDDGASTIEKKKLDWFIPVFAVGFAFGLAGVLLERLSDLDALSLAFICVGAVMMSVKTLIRAVLKIVRSRSVDENLLVAISVFGAVAIDQGMEGLMVIILYQIGKFFEQYAVERSRNSIKNLMLVKPESAETQIDGEWKELPLGEVAEGSLIRIKPGGIVPLDGIVENGSCSLDMSSLTGESVPVEAVIGSELLSGSVNLNGLIEIRTTGVDAESTITRILNLVETASERKAKSETIVSRVAKYYVPAVVVCAAVVAVCFALFGNLGLRESLYRGMVFLVVSCPCAVAISVPLSYFSGIGNASKKGILIKGTNFLDNVVNIKAVAFDKTGTITTGEFGVARIETFDPCYTEEEILKLAYLGERSSTHPLAKAIVAFAQNSLNEIDDKIEVTELREKAGKGVSYTIDGQRVLIGKSNRQVSEAETAVAVSVDGIEIGYIYLTDTIKEGAKEAVAYLKDHGIATKMLTGDNFSSALAVAAEANVDSFAAGMLPDDKFEEMEYMLAHKKRKSDMVAFAGDGINDAPVLGRADIGIAMGLAGSAATVDTADIVLMNDDLRQLIALRKLSVFTRRIVFENIFATLLVKFTFVALGLAGITGLAWAVFADVGLTICTILNSLRVLRYDLPKERKANASLTEEGCQTCRAACDCGKADCDLHKHLD